MIYITKVQYDKNNQRIIGFEYEQNGESKRCSKEGIAKYILNGNKAKTKVNGRIGEEVDVVVRTIANGCENDNLENLPRF